VQESLDLGGAQHRTADQLEAGLAHILNSPSQQGIVELMVCRPRVGSRKVLHNAQLDLRQGLLGDNWLARGFRKRTDGSAHPDMQINLMNSRVISLVAGARQNWPLAGDQFYVDLDRSKRNLPPGTRLALGTAIIEITAEPHQGCKKFSERFGLEAMKFVNSGRGKALNLRGINARVVKAGELATGAVITKLG